MKILIFSVGLAIFPLLAAGQEIVPIIQCHQNDSQGILIELPEITLVGTVTTSGTNLLASGFAEYFLQDSTAGILLTSAEQLQPGDIVRVTGTLFQRQGLTAFHSQATQLLGTENIPAPRVLNCGQVTQTFQAENTEPNESRLIRLNQVTLRNTPPYPTLLDNSGACRLYLDPHLEIRPPVGTFSIIGVLIQVDNAAPFRDNYLILPRMNDDIIYQGAPRFLKAPLESNIQPDQVTLTWETDQLASSVVKFGATSKLEGGRIGDSSRVYTHQITVDGLTAATIYYYQVISANQYGTTPSKTYLFSTSSAPESRGIIQIYFNKSVDTKVAGESTARGNTRIDLKLYDRIAASRYSIDICIYNITLNDLTPSLLDAHQRGVSIRLITDNDNRKDRFKALTDAGIPIIDDTFGANDGQAYMHNKFAVFDARNQVSASDDWVWTGSYNFTNAATFQNAEHALEIQDQALAQCYLVEFNEMWGSTTETPDAEQSRFGSRKTNNTPHIFNIHGIPVRQYMSPSDQVLSHFLEMMETADSSFRFCIYNFTHLAIAQKMQQIRERIPNFRISGVFDYASSFQTDNLYRLLKNTEGSGWQPPADVWFWQTSNLLHHKYLIIDGELPQSNPTVITGSYNWSISADRSNDENLLMITDARIANLFHQEFNARYQEGYRVDVENKPVTAGLEYTLLPNYPNPFNARTQITYCLGSSAPVNLTIFNTQGQMVRQLVAEIQPAGTHTLAWDGVNQIGVNVSSGIYFCQLTVRNEVRRHKMICLK
ncbi:phospholipase D-like domain-containing protein [candidate division KSB1 bacterium]|nr:phospholipase D-like domain-containing protein [candidate division KSB1 bacterium]